MKCVGRVGMSLCPCRIANNKSLPLIRYSTKRFKCGIVIQCFFPNPFRDLQALGESVTC